MTTQQIVGVVLILTALVDIVLGLVVIGPRIENPDSRRTVMIALTIGAVLLGTLGVLFLAGVL